ncbi:hypothetical protein P3T24_004350 [Paraburkholderia sp. GAS33]|uniref:hypothetical protein n=1 Tax=Paraburkholderia sp. GAS33 TaxID=3035130 RepID=UPI003D20FB4D
MTVGELIEELRKFPEHHVVYVVHPDGEDGSTDDFGVTDAIGESSIADVYAGDRCTVVVDCMPGSA